ncbi:hypothetical protein HUU05_25950 [candidate division KSB1 bacterium]|nr:hypothetical protein [candidate division KSB1 bacterium]
MKYLVAIVLLAGTLANFDFQAAAQARTQPRAQLRLKENRSERLTSEGLALLQQGKNRLALLKFEEAIRLDARNANAYAGAALLYLKDNKIEAAHRYAETALRLQPQNARAHFVAAQVLLQEHKKLAAFDHLRKAVRYSAGQPDEAEANRLLARFRNENPKLLQLAAPQVATPALPPANDTSAALSHRPLLAVFPFSAVHSDSAEHSLGKTLAEMLTTALINRNNYRIIERNQLERVFQEQALGQSGALESETAVAVGNILGVQAVVVGTLSKPAQAFEADARILNVSTGEAMTACYAKGSSSAQLRQMAETLAAEIAGKAALVQSAVRRDSAKTAVEN